MKTLILKHWRAIVLVVGVVLFSKAMYDWGSDTSNQEWQLKWTQRDLDAALARGKLESEHRERERQLNAQLEQQQVIYDQRLVEMQSLQLNARVESDGLRKQLEDLRDKLASAGSQTSSDSWQLPSVTRAAMVLSDLYGSCVGHRQELAAGLDQSRQRGLAVEQMYDKARGQ